MKSLLLATTAVALLCSAAHAAAHTHITGILSSILEADFPEAVMLKAAPFDTVAFDGRTVALTKTTMAELVAQFGGKLQEPPASEGARPNWLCYDDAGTRTWFYSDANDTTKNPSVTTIVEELATTPAAASGCTDVSAALVPVAGDLPGVGAKLDDLKTRFGDAKPDSNGHLNYGFVAESAVQNVFYIVKNGVVTSVAYSEYSLGKGDTL